MDDVEQRQTTSVAEQRHDERLLQAENEKLRAAIHHACNLHEAGMPDDAYGILSEIGGSEEVEVEKLRTAVKDMATCDDSSQWKDETTALAMKLLNGGDDDVEEELQSAYHVLADKQAQIDTLRAVMKQAAEWLEWVDSFPLPLDARRKLNETKGLLRRLEHDIHAGEYNCAGGNDG